MPQGSFPLGRRNEPQPDFALLAPIDYVARDARPTLSEIFAFIEVAVTSVAFDRGRKMRMYGAQRVNEYLLVDVPANRLTFFGKPNDVGYAESRELSYGDRFGLAALPEIELAAEPFLDARGFRQA